MNPERLNTHGSASHYNGSKSLLWDTWEAVLHILGMPFICMLDESGEQFYLPVNHKQATFNLRRWASGDQLEKNNEHQWLNTYEKKLTNGCLQMVHTIDLAASLILAWLFDTFPLPLSALRSRFWAALAPYVCFLVSQRRIRPMRTNTFPIVVKHNEGCRLTRTLIFNT